MLLRFTHYWQQFRKREGVLIFNNIERKIVIFFGAESNFTAKITLKLNAAKFYTMSAAI